MELKDLEGTHTLDAVEFSISGGSQIIYFRLDGQVFAVTEDEDDGYRSAMEDIQIVDREMSNTFEPVVVWGKHINKCADILELIDIITERVVLEVGTDESDDYYPQFVANFRPEAMVINAEQIKKDTE
jgi:hypothetical protein